MRVGEFKLRQKEVASRWRPTPEMERDAVRLLKQGVSKKILCTIFSCTYEDLKVFKSRHA